MLERTMKSTIEVLFLLSLPAMTGAFSASSSFSGSALPTNQQCNSYRWSMYNDERKNEPGDHNAWSVLATTEKWISNTLNSANSGNPNNPYARKEVSYVCENQTSSPMVISNMFKWLKEARRVGERHSETEIDREEEQGDTYKPSTLRQTQVMVIPSCSEFESFPVFDTLVQTVNQARRNARDYVTDIDEDDDMNAWSVAINCAHMHPKYGEKTAEQELAELKAEEESGEVDLNLQAYQQTRLAARRSPYPSVVIEVRASPAPDFGTPTSTPVKEEKKGEVSASDIQQLEALFGKSAAVKDKDPEASFWDQVGSQIQEVSAVTPIRLAEEWIARQGETQPAAFTESGTRHIDSAYQFIFANIAMMEEQSNASVYYIVLPNFMSSAATSFEKFSTTISDMLNVVHSTRGRFKIVTYHPEHVDSEHRSPSPILALRKL